MRGESRETFDLENIYVTFLLARIEMKSTGVARVYRESHLG